MVESVAFLCRHQGSFEHLAQPLVRQLPPVRDRGRTFGTNTRLRWTFNPRGDFFLIYNHDLREVTDRWLRDSNELLVKAQYTFRR
jgi:hypothetical protein